jgi:phosphate transport system ATP-binding protein
MSDVGSLGNVRPVPAAAVPRSPRRASRRAVKAEAENPINVESVDATNPASGVAETADVATAATSVAPVSPETATSADAVKLAPIVIDVTDHGLTGAKPSGAHLDAHRVSAWFGSNKVLERVSLSMPPGVVTSLIGPSGCGKSTFLRILNRMHESVPSAKLAGEVRLNGDDIYGPGQRLTETRKRIGMVFQKPNPFPAMSIAENVVAGLKLTGSKVSRSERDALIESCLQRGGLWNEVKDRLDRPGGALSGGQQQRLCIARSLAVNPDVLLMDEPCSALDPTSTRRIEETISALRDQVTIVIVTHNMQQAARVSQQCAFFLAEQGTPGAIVEAGPTADIFERPQDPRTSDYVNGRFG